MNRLTIVMYHYVRDLASSGYPRLTALEADLFYRQLRYFQEQYTPVSMNDVIHASTAGGGLPESALLLTFDDGYSDHYRVVYPLLRDAGIRGVFFVPGMLLRERKVMDVNKIQFVLACAEEADLIAELYHLLDLYREEYDYPSNEVLYARYATTHRYDTPRVRFIKQILQTALPGPLRSLMCDKLFEKYVGIPEAQFADDLYLNQEQLKEMYDAGMFVGIHGYAHEWMSEMSPEELDRDLSMALDVMSPYIDRDRWVINYPYGKYHEGVIRQAKEKGACMGMSVRVGQARIGVDDPYQLPRLDCNDFLDVP